MMGMEMSERHLIYDDFSAFLLCSLLCLCMSMYLKLSICINLRPRWFSEKPVDLV